MNTEYLERRAFNAGWIAGRYSARLVGAWTHPSYARTTEVPPEDVEWEKYRAQPVQLELDLRSPDES